MRISLKPFIEILYRFQDKFQFGVINKYSLKYEIQFCKFIFLRKLKPD